MRKYGGSNAISAKNSGFTTAYIEGNSSNYASLWVINNSSGNAVGAINNSTSYPTIYGNNPSGRVLDVSGNNGDDYAGVIINNAGSSSPGLYVRGYIQATGSISPLKSATGEGLGFGLVSNDIELVANGTAKLENGEIKVSLGDAFRLNVAEPNSINVTVTPIDTWSGIYVTSVSVTGFTVKSENGNRNARFHWIAIGKRVSDSERVSLSNKIFGASENAKQRKVPLGGELNNSSEENR